MHKKNLISFIIFGLIFPVLVFSARAQNPPPLVITPPSQEGPGGEWQLQLAESPPVRTINAAANSCSAATTLPLPGGDGSNVNLMGEEPSDPVLACMWGSPSRPQGYRTVWYKFTAPTNGRVTIETLGSTYDTVIGVYMGDCASLIQLACNDDAEGFTSRVDLEVVQGTTYYIEVADWQFAPPSPATLSITALLNPVDSLWQQTDTMPIALSRHAAVPAGNDIYVIGGQTSLGSIPEISRNVYRFETYTGNWVPLTAMPGNGYSNTTAVFLDTDADNGRIYLPSGDSGNPNAFDITHWAYDIAGNYWFSASPATTVTGVSPFAWSAAVAVPSQNAYYVTGGLLTQPPLSGSAQVSNQLLYYSAPTDTWLRRSNMTEARYAHTAALLGNYICVVGGLGADGTNVLLFTDGECYDINGSGWTREVAALNIPRYNAASAVGSDGRWYVYGGISANGSAVSVTEVYNFANNTWTKLDVTYDLGASATEPARAWPRGGFVGNNLWALGGNTSPGNQVVSLINKLYMPSLRAFIPVLARPIDTSSDDTFALAKGLALNGAQWHNFSDLLDFYDVFFFDLPTSSSVTVSLTQIPSGSDYNIRVYGANKLLWGTGENPGNLNESVPLTLAADRYYVMVERVFPYGDPDPANYVVLVSTP